LSLVSSDGYGVPAIMFLPYVRIDL